jgi:hypothetical protein
MNAGDPVDKAAEVAPADLRARGRWARWKIVLAYAVLFGAALGAIWLIDDHVLKATPAATTTRAVH